MNELEQIEIRKNRFWFKASLLLTALIIFMGICVGLGSAVNCNSTLGSFPFMNNTCNVPSSLTLNTGTYYCNGTGTGATGGCIIINGNNLILDGNGSRIVGNYSSSGIFKFSSTQGNVTIKNFILTNYQRGLSLRHGYNFTITNISFYNFTDYGATFGNQTNINFFNNYIYSNNTVNSIGLSIDTSANNQTITSNYFLKGLYGIDIGAGVGNYTNILNNYFNESWLGVYGETGTSFSNLINNTFYNVTAGSRFNIGYYNNFERNTIIIYNNTGLQFVTQQYSNITNNTIIGTNLNSTNNFGISISGSSNLTITRNYIERAYYSIFLTSSPYNNVTFNTIMNTTPNGIQAMGISSRTSSNYNNFFNNYIYNTGWNGFDIDSSYNVIDNNYIYNSAHNGIDLYSGGGYSSSQGTGNLIIKNYINNSYGDGVLLVNQNNTIISSNIIENNNYANFPIGIEGNNTFTFNNTIYNNTIRNFSYAMFLSSNDTNIIGNYFYNYSSGLIDSRGFYADNTNSSFYLQSNNFYDFELIKIFYRNSRVKDSIYVTMGKSYFLYNNDSQNSFTSYFFNNTKTLIYFSNGSVACSDISTCNGNINITLTPNNYSYVLDNYNKTEGVTRSNDPITLTSSSYTSKTYTSTLNELVTVPTVNFIVADCTSVGVITSDTQTFNPDSYTCSDYRVTLLNAEIGTGDTEFSILYNQANVDICTGFESAGTSMFQFVTILIIIAVLVFIFFMMGFFSDQEIDMNTLAIGIVIAGIIITIGFVIISRIGNC